MKDKDVIIGIILGLISVVLGTLFSVLIVSITQNSLFSYTLSNYWNTGNMWGMIALGSLMNLGLFFLFLQKDQDNRSKGILIATILTALTVYIIYLF